MPESPTLLGLEIVVDDLDRALAFFIDVLGVELVSRASAGAIEGEMAVVDCGSIAITLLAPVAHGPGPILANRDPRVSQLVFGAPGGDGVAALQQRMTEEGLAVAPAGPGSFFVSPESMVGALGVPTAVVIVPAPDPA